MKTQNNTTPMQMKNVLVVASVSAAILTIPLVAMIIENLSLGNNKPSVHWTFLDFAVMGCLLFGVGMLIELLRLKVRNTSIKIALIVLLICMFALVWIDLSVGIFNLPFSGS